MQVTSYMKEAAAAAGAVADALLPKAGCIKYAQNPSGTGMKIKPPVPPVIYNWPDEATGTVYLAGPILGKTYTDCRFGWRQTVALALHDDIIVLSPMRHEGHLSEHTGPIDDDVIDKATHFFAGSKIIFAKDVLDIRHCDIVLANFLGATRPSLGTVSEIGMAHILNKTIVTVMEDDNIHQHPFVLEPSALVLNNLDDAITAINSLLSTGI